MAEKAEKKETGKKAKENKEKQEKESKKKLERQVITLFIVLGIIFVSIVAFIISYQIGKQRPDFKYGDFSVYKERLEGTTVDFYIIPINVFGRELNVALRSDPRKIKDISMEINEELLDEIDEIWITTSPGLESDAIIATNEIGSFTGSIGLRTGYALTEVVGEYPVMKCENASAKKRVIEVRLGNSTKIYSEDKCIIVQGKDYEDMIKAADRFVILLLEKLIR